MTWERARVSTATLCALVACGALAHAEPTPGAGTRASGAPDLAAFTRLPVVPIAPHLVAPHVPGRRVPVRADPSFAAPGVRVDMPQLPSERARATIRRTLAIFVDEGARALEDARGRRTITCRAHLAQTNLVSYLCGYEGGAGEQARFRHAAYTFTVDGDDVRLVDVRAEVGSSPRQASDPSCYVDAQPFDCVVHVAFDRRGMWLFFERPRASPREMLSRHHPFDRMQWSLYEEGVAARIPGAIERSRRRPRLLGEDPPEVGLPMYVASRRIATEYEVLVGDPAPLDVLARRLRDARQVATVPRADGLYQIVSLLGNLEDVRDLGEPRARVSTPARSYDATSLCNAVTTTELALRASPDERDAVTQTLPGGTRVKVVHGYVGAQMSDVTTPGAFVYVVGDAHAGYAVAAGVRLTEPLTGQRWSTSARRAHGPLATHAR